MVQDRSGSQPAPEDGVVAGTGLEEAVDRLGELIDAFENHPDADVRDQVDELLQAVDTLHRSALVRIAGLLAHHELLEHACADPVIGEVFDLYDLAPPDAAEAAAVPPMPPAPAATPPANPNLIRLQDVKRIPVAGGSAPTPPPDLMARAVSAAPPPPPDLRARAAAAAPAPPPDDFVVRATGPAPAAAPPAASPFAAPGPASAAKPPAAAPVTAPAPASPATAPSSDDDFPMHLLRPGEPRRTADSSTDRPSSPASAAPDGPVRAALPPLPGDGDPEWTELFTTDFVPAGTMAASADGEILICNVDGTIHAVRDRCGGSPLPLHFGDLTAGRVACPWHKGCMYDLTNGESTTGRRTIVYPAAIEDGRIRVALNLGRATGPLQPGFAAPM